MSSQTRNLFAASSMNRPCVQAAKTLSAPPSRRIFAAVAIVPPVEMISSRITADPLTFTCPEVVSTVRPSILTFS